MFSEVSFDTIYRGKVPAWRNEAGKQVVHETKAEAQAEVLDDFLSDSVSSFAANGISKTQWRLRTLSLP